MYIERDEEEIHVVDGASNADATGGSVGAPHGVYVCRVTCRVRRSRELFRFFFFFFRKTSFCPI